MKKSIVMVLAFALVLGVAIGGTLAWLQDITTPVVNTFTEGKVDIDLYEHEYDSANNALTNTVIRGDAAIEGDEGNTYKMVPGDVLPKDPTVVVKAGSEACWLFVKIDKTENVDTFLSYEIADGWAVLDATNYPGIYYRAVGDTDADQTFAVLKDNRVTVKTEVNMGNMTGLDSSNYPKLTFTAYAIQSANLPDTDQDGTTVDEAWAALNP